MACNCVTSNQLKELYAQFGSKKETEGLNGLSKIKYYLIKGGAALITLITIPFIFVYITYMIIFNDGKISLKKFFGLKGEKNIYDYYYEQQQKLQNKN